MKNMKLNDAVQVADDSVRFTKDGYLTANSAVARADSVQTYLGKELGMDKDYIRLYRPKDEVFSKDSMASLAHKPITNGHPSEDVNSQTWADNAVGTMSTDVARDGEFVRTPLTLMDESAINDWREGKRELSAGYSCNIDWTEGVTDSGQPYDGIQRDIRYNHVALVSAGRAGSDVRIGDDSRAPNDANTHAAKEVNAMATRVVDGFSVETSEQGAQAIDKLMQQVADAQEKLDAAQSEQAEAVEAKDKELASKDAEIEDLKGKVMSDAEIDEKVKQRAELIADAKTVADLDFTGCSEAEIRRKAVAHHLGDELVAEKSDAYVEARYDALKDAGVEVEQQDPVLEDQQQAQDSAAELDPYAAFHARQAAKLAGE